MKRLASILILMTLVACGDGGVYREPIVAFLRWKLHQDAGGEAWFVGDARVLCEAADWSFDTR